MCLYIDEKYVSLIASKLPLYSRKSDGTHNFRCPICGDSKTKKTRKRGYFYPVKDGLLMKCHNCHVSLPFSAFLKTVDEALYKSYYMERFKYNNEHRWHAKEVVAKEQVVEKANKKSTIGAGALNYLDCLADLPPDHPCVVYVKNRKIPDEYLSKLYYAPNYKEWVNAHIHKDKFEKPGKSDPRLVIPFLDRKGVPYGYQGRYIGTNQSEIRYITIHEKQPDEETATLLYGLEKINLKKTVYVLEGPIDSMFVPNALAAAGSSLKKILKDPPANFVFAFDNEPRSREITKIMKEVISKGHQIIIWPSFIKSKDVNAMILSGDVNINEINDLLVKNTFKGLTADLEFTKWKKS